MLNIGKQYGIIKEYSCAERAAYERVAPMF